MNTASQPSQRLLSLDVVRGLTMIMMVIVNNPGTWDHIYWPLEHAEWNGFTPTDFVFPNFLFLVGVAIVFALSRKRDQRQEFGSIMLHAFKRCVILACIGMFITLFVIKFDFANMRFPGVLQRIGIVYFICCALYLKLRDRTMWILAFALLVIYYVLLKFVPVPGFGPPDLMNPEANIGAWLDRLIFHPNHLFRFTKTWDPEGLLTTIPSVSTGLFGVLTGITLKSALPAADKLKRFFGIGIALIVGGLLANFAFTINKGLWTSSYVMLTSGLSMTLLGAAYWLIDVKGVKGWTKWPMVFGIN
jgi:predicted acyltransferase